MDYQLNLKKTPSPVSLAADRPLHERKLQYQERIDEHAILPSSTTLSPTYLTADPWKPMTITDTLKVDDGHKRQDMELKNIGKMGIMKRKQFLQKRDFSRSHEVRKMISYFVVKFNINIDFLTT
ncbi:unnamed protein product [Adineta steineri]|uniref:Uncharacterized protein n=1 Tax=Adineta steineri TaxID=433720 RepID=A0A814WHG0_9BILA|nr:unnamed protein product [Adineta steineri]